MSAIPNSGKTQIKCTTEAEAIELHFLLASLAYGGMGSIFNPAESFKRDYPVIVIDEESKRYDGAYLHIQRGDGFPDIKKFHSLKEFRSRRAEITSSPIKKIQLDYGVAYDEGATVRLCSDSVAIVVSKKDLQKILS